MDSKLTRLAVCFALAFAGMHATAHAAPAVGKQPASGTTTGSGSAAPTTPPAQPPVDPDANNPHNAKSQSQAQSQTADPCLDFKAKVRASAVHRAAPNAKPADLPKRITVVDGAHPTDKEMAAAAKQRQDDIACFQNQLKTGFESAPEGIASTLLQTIGQVVVDRAVANAWQLLSSRLEDAAGCSDAATKFPAVCKVLETSDLQNLISSPTILLEAAEKDLLAILRSELGGISVTPLNLPSGAVVDVQQIAMGVLDAWVGGGKAAALTYLRAQWLAIIQQITVDYDVACADTDTLCKALVAAGNCLVNNNTLSKDIATCAMMAAPAGNIDANAVAVQQLATVIEQAVIQNDRDALIKLLISVVRQYVAATYSPLLDGVQDLLLGLSDEDWTRAGAGGVEVLQAIVALHNQSKDPLAGKDKLFALLAAIGQYAATYVDSSTKDPTAAAAARRQAIESLIAMTTDRSARQSGLVVSVGGQFGLGYGQRYGTRATGADPTALATPLHLALGLGFDSYHASTSVGLHAMVTLFDLSQYVSFEDSNFTVANPDAKAALAIGGTVGLRLALKQTPLFVGANVTYAPFVPVVAPGDTVTPQTGSFQIMGLVAIYVPIFDFN
jgi:hypothetical protein|nr:hypothetical protein [Kofleriaceae bacterium]